jgi:hypothetical protein
MRDRDVRNDIVARLIATNAFDPGAVWLWCPDDLGEGTSLTSAVGVEPESSSQRDEWDDQPGGGLIVTSTVMITVYHRLEDTQLRDEGAERLLAVAANALNGKALANLTMPALTRFVSWRWQTPAPPERKIVATFSYQYISEGWVDYDTEE